MTEENNVLQAVGIYKGASNNTTQFFNVVGKDETGKTYGMLFACQLHYTESMFKYLKRLHPISTLSPGEGEKKDE
jgi:hypothetical protein